MGKWLFRRTDERKQKHSAKIEEKFQARHTRKCSKGFARLMLQGKVHAALRLLEKNQDLGVAELSDANITILKTLHPESEPADESILMTGDLPYFDPIIFDDIDEQSIAKAANKTRGAAGPSGMDADNWRCILISKDFGNTGKELRKTMAKMTRKLCTREVGLISGSNRTSIEAPSST